MPDALGWRKKFGVIAPSTNTIVEPDFYRMTVPGVTAHFSRIHIRNQNLSDDAGFEGLLDADPRRDRRTRSSGCSPASRTTWSWA